MSAAVEAARLTAGGITFLVAAWGIIIGLCLWCFARLLRKGGPPGD